MPGKEEQWEMVRFGHRSSDSLQGKQKTYLCRCLVSMQLSDVGFLYNVLLDDSRGRKSS
jgi:hypothetical protein